MADKDPKPNTPNTPNTPDTTAPDARPVVSPDRPDGTTRPPTPLAGMSATGPLAPKKDDPKPKGERKGRAKKKEPEPEPEPAEPKPTTAEALRVYALLTNIKKEVEILGGLVDVSKSLPKTIQELWAAAREACPLVK